MEKKKKQNIADINISKSKIFLTETPERTRELGEKFAKKLKKGDIVFLKGELGSGKTTFTQGIARAFGNKGFARSSSFVLVSEYNADKCSLYHLDLYRLNPASVWDLGIEEYLFSGNIAVVEWADRLVGAQNDNTWSVEIESFGDKRKIKIEKRK
ncbi:MAG: tRNA (adenosine(37)-N6)-threonylcarbamoyltransferase complex ATPase subunit type 1 TsaE [Endomicrobium sp.]|jgi:tRNA threonylcarbamoyladenosine biosynthesis protein TsaE|nr:tRNA (adenosine(37)-N6)-threonylcarbamoyltransferase complex ATPase subunit type 1 TsaE [Endomicrobium sp.]